MKKIKLLIAIVVSAVLLSNVYAEIEPRAFIYSELPIYASCAYQTNPPFIVEERMGTVVTSKKVVGAYFSADGNNNNGTEQHFDLVLQFADGSEGKVNRSDNIISYTIDYVNYPKKGQNECYYEDGWDVWN